MKDPKIFAEIVVLGLSLVKFQLAWLWYALLIPAAVFNEYDALTLLS